MIRFLYINSFIVVFTICQCFWAAIVSLFDNNGTLIHRLCAVPWAKTILFISGVRLKVEGKNNIDAHSPHIYVSNHQSYFDIFALLAGLSGDFKFILKQELMKIPFVGPSMRKAGYISIDRSDIRKAVKSMDKAAKKIKAGLSVLIFPEGTRSEDGHVAKFKRGGFHLALKSGCDLVPVAIINSRDIVPKGSLRINKGIIRMVIGRPIPVTGYSKKNIAQLAEKAREAVISLMSGAGGEIS